MKFPETRGFFSTQRREDAEKTKRLSHVFLCVFASLRRKKAASILLLLSAATLFAADGRLFYSRSFPGSTPAYLEVTIEKTGDAIYKEAPDDELPLKFKLNDADVEEIFTLAGKLDYFKRPLESQLRVAFMGAKILRFEKDEQKNEQKFNYSEDQTAQWLVDWFERMAESAQRRIDLERAAKYDHLGVDKALSTLEVAIEENRVVALEQFLPMLDRIAKNETYMHQSRSKAAEVAEFIRKPKK